jgi:RNA polymerase sigma-70 factor (ECF subfamily)
MTGQDTDSELVRRFQRGDAGALEELVTRHRVLLYGYIVNQTRGGDDADEIFQEVWFRVIRKAARYRDRNFRGWLLRIAHNLVIDRARRRKPDTSLDAETAEGHSMMDILPNKDFDPAATAVDQDLGGRIRDAVAVLPEEQRETFVLRMQADLPFKEIATIQGVSINTALARMQYALAKLRAVLREDYEVLSS